MLALKVTTFTKFSLEWRGAKFKFMAIWCLKIYKGAIIYEMWVQVNNAMHVPIVNNKNQEM